MAADDPTLLHRILFDAEQSSSIAISESEAIVANAMTVEAKKKIAQLEEEPSCEGVQLGRLETATAAHKALPAKIIIKIFRYSAYGGEHKYPPNVRSVPWVFRQICAPWREAVLLEASVWNNILVERNAAIPGASKIEEHLKFLIDRIANPSQPLSLESKCNNFDQYALNFVIRPHHARIHHLAMTASLAALAFSRPPGPWNAVDRTSPFHASRFFSGMNRLRSLHIDVPPHPVWNVSTFHLPESIPWKQLTSLTLVAVDNKTKLVLDDTLRVLASCSNLEQCRLEILIDDRQSTHPPISLPRLTSLNFHVQIIDSPSASFLDFLVTPALVALHPTPFDPAATLSLIHRSGCILRKLKVPYTSERRNLSESELEKLHSLLELQAGNMFFDDSTITKIAEGILLPEMDTLSLSPRSMDEIDSFQRLVEGRWKASSRGLNETTEAEGDEPPTPTPRALRQLRVVLGGILAFQDKSWAPSRFRQFGAYKTGVRVELVPQVMDALHGTIVYASEDWTDE